MFSFGSFCAVHLFVVLKKTAFVQIIPVDGLGNHLIRQRGYNGNLIHLNYNLTRVYSPTYEQFRQRKTHHVRTRRQRTIA